MHRGRTQKLNTFQLFLSRRGQWRRHYKLGPYRRKRPSSIADPLVGHVPVAYDDMEARLNARYRETKTRDERVQYILVYPKLRNQITKEIRDAIRDYYRQLIDENIGNAKKMWKAINNVLGKKENSVKLSSVEIEGKYLTRKRDILEALNQHFVSVGPNLAKKITAKPGDDCLQNITLEQKEITFKTVSSMHIVNEINKLRIGKAAGPDNIPITVVRDVGDLVAKPLAMIFNSSLENGIFPDIWKLARVTPILKSGVKKGFKQLQVHFGHFSLFQDLGAHSARSDPQLHS